MSECSERVNYWKLICHVTINSVSYANIHKTRFEQLSCHHLLVVMVAGEKVSK